ncbi:MAG: hypothetical protein ABSC10_20060 [Candidatus Acidiferrales bacterium]|jgi:hypothetical protein
MNRRRNNRIPLRCVAAILTYSVLPGIAASQSATVTDPPGFHFMLRLEGDKTTYKLGEAIHLEVSCNSDLSQRYTSTCGDDTGDAFTDVEVVALDAKSKLAVDPVETHWIGKTLCPSARYVADNLSGEASLPVVGVEIHWRKMTLSEHYPMSAGRFHIQVVTRGAISPGGQVFTASSLPVEVSVVDDPQWRAATLRDAISAVKALDPLAPASASNSEYDKVQYMPDLEVLHWLISENGYGFEAEVHPDRRAVAKFLREYLNKKVGNDILFKETVEAVLALELSSGSPKLYARAVVFQDALGEPSPDDLRDLRAWLLPRYRQLMLEVARSMITTHKQALGSYEDDNLEFKAENLVSLDVPECSKTRNFLSESELRRFMREAGLSSKFITEQIAEMRETRMELRKAE